MFLFSFFEFFWFILKDVVFSSFYLVCKWIPTKEAASCASAFALLRSLVPGGPHISLVKAIALQPGTVPGGSAAAFPVKLSMKLSRSKMPSQKEAQKLKSLSQRSSKNSKQNKKIPKHPLQLAPPQKRKNMKKHQAPSCFLLPRNRIFSPKSPSPTSCFHCPTVQASGTETSTPRRFHQEHSVIRS